MTTETVMKKAPVLINYYIENTTTKLAPSDDQGQKEIGSNYTSETKVIEPVVEKQDLPDRVVTKTTKYELVKVPEDKEGTVPAEGKVVNYYYRPVVEEVARPNEAPKVDIPEYNGHIGIPGTPEVHEKPEYNEVIGIPGTPEVHEKPEYNGGAVPLDPPVVTIPEHNEPIGTPGTPEVHDKPEYNGGVVPLDPPVVTIPEYNEPIGIPGTPEVHEKPEYKIPEEPVKPEQPKPNAPIVEQPKKELPLIPQKQLPNTGDASILTAVSGMVMMGIGALVRPKRKK